MKEGFETRCIHGDLETSMKDEYRAISFPIYQTASFSHIQPGHNESGFDYTRESNPTRQKLEEVVSSLEGAAGTAAFSSGMAAISACFELFSPGDHILCSDDLYGGVVRLHTLIGRKNGLLIDYVDSSDLNAVRDSITPQTRCLYIETPSNPMMKITDIRGCAKIAREKGLLLMVDNTFLSPCFQTPLALGADIVIHSGTKFLSGHNDTVAGFACFKDKSLYERVKLISKTTGSALAPFDCWLLLRGIKTLSVRMERHQKNAQQVADWLLQEPRVTQVFYPGLKDHPGYAINQSQSKGSGSMISFYVENEETALRILRKVRVITFAESLGGIESLLTYPIVQTHPDVPKETREKLGITETLLRLSVGLEDPEDLIRDLAQAFDE